MNRLIPLISVAIVFAAITVGRSQTGSQEPPQSQTESNAAVKGNEYKVTLEREAGAIVVKVGDDLFTRYDYATYAKPILYPVFCPNQIPMTRNWPMKLTDGEADDHPHHKSIWLGHEINGVDFWSEKTGAVKHDSIFKIDSDHETFTVNNNWVTKKDGTVICTETSSFGFGATADKRWIDATFTFHASHGEIHFEDTKEGMFAVRTHPDLRLSPDEKRGVQKVFGQAINSEGTTGQAIWGQKAKWVYYWGTIEQQEVGIAIFDHASNFRHPTTWHAREYGLIAANPFGLHAFQNLEQGVGVHTVNNGGEITFRYRIVFQLGRQTSEELNRQFEEFVGH